MVTRPLMPLVGGVADFGGGPEKKLKTLVVFPPLDLRIVAGAGAADVMSAAFIVFLWLFKPTAFIVFCNFTDFGRRIIRV
jgi:hypothetical protein